MHSFFTQSLFWVLPLTFISVGRISQHTRYRICVRYIVFFLLSLLFTSLFWLRLSCLLLCICQLIIQYKVYVSCIICTNCVLLLIVHFIEYFARMSYLSEVMDKLDNDGVLHSADSNTVFWFWNSWWYFLCCLIKLGSIYRFVF